MLGFFVDVGCKRGRQLGSVLEERVALGRVAHHGGNERLGHASCSGHGASQHPNPARGVSNERRRHSGVEVLRSSATDVTVTHACASNEGVDPTPSLSR